MTLQVLVAGAGPVGLTMAAELAHFGVELRVIDKAAARSDKSKAMVLWSRTLELLDRLGSSEPFLKEGHKVLAANIFAGGSPLAHVDLTVIDSPYNFALMLPQSDTERLLEDRLETLGQKVERQVELTSFRDTGSGVTSVVRHADGSEETVESEWLIDCGGAHSLARQALALPFEGSTMQNDFVLADVRLTGLPVPPSELAIYWHREGALLFLPFGGDRYRVVADLGRSVAEHPQAPTLQEIQSIIAQRGPGGITASDPRWLSAFRINERKVKDYRVGRVFLAGDAAHIHSPAGGQGMNTGMQDAVNLAWKLALVLQGKCAADRLLDSYSAERSPVAAQVLAQSGHLTEIATIRNPMAQTIRNAVGHLVFGLAPVRRAMAETLSEVTIGYPDSPLNGPRSPDFDHLHPGERIPPSAWRGPGDGTARFTLFGEPGDGTSRLAGQFADLVQPRIEPALQAGGMWLSRPDGYLAASAREDDIAELADYLASLRA